MNDATLRRRANYLLTEALVDPTPTDQTIKMTMRVITNVIGCGSDVGSQRYKLLTHFMSRKALIFRQACKSDQKSYFAGTINEHPDELADVWSWIVGNRHKLSADDILNRFRKWPMVVILKEENDEIRKFRGQGPEIRYAAIDVLQLEQGVWQPRRRQ